ncbi:MAG: DUF559 domain-containing protein, partial [Solirubrobacteraceae bacterium]
QVWRVVQVGDAQRGKPERPARVSHVLQVEAAGERGLAEVAGAQRAMVHRAQLRALGIGRGSYNHRLATGALHRVFPSVLSVVHPVLEPWALETAALLYAGDDAVLSHESAAAVWELADAPPIVAITLIGRKARRQPRLRLHEVESLDIRDIGVHRGFPVTAPARTLIDCAARGPVDRLLNEARLLKLVKDADLHAAMARCPGRSGTGPLRALLATEQGLRFQRSEAERLLKRVIADAGLPLPVFNAGVLGYEADAHWPQQRVIVEVDGYAAHGHRMAFERDRDKDQTLIAAGYVVLRITWHQLTQRPIAVAARLAAALARRG